MNVFRRLLMIAAISILTGCYAHAQAVRSYKRGVCANKLTEADVKALSPGVSWAYNWHFCSEMPLAAGNIEFLPMAWGNHPNILKGLKEYLAAGNKPSYILAINEPNLVGESTLTPQQTAATFKEVKKLADSYGIKLVGPHMAVGTPADASITAYDPIQKKDVKYTFMIPFLDAYHHYVGKDMGDFVAVHSYGNIYELKWVIDMLYEKYGKPIWVTEFAMAKSHSAEEELRYMIEAVDFLESSPYVAKYAWFKADMPGDRHSLLTTTPGKLTKLGQFYVNMPVHNPRHFYPIPGKVQAENYVSKSGGDPVLSNDTDKFLVMAVKDKKNWLEYNLKAPKPGIYSVSVRVSSSQPVHIALIEGDHLLGAVADEKTDKVKNGWRTLSSQVSLPAGDIRIRLQGNQADLRVNWLEFVEPGQPVANAE